MQPRSSVQVTFSGHHKKSRTRGNFASAVGHRAPHAEGQGHRHHRLGRPFSLRLSWGAHPKLKSPALRIAGGRCGPFEHGLDGAGVERPRDLSLSVATFHQVAGLGEPQSSSSSKKHSGIELEAARALRARMQVTARRGDIAVPEGRLDLWKRGAAVDRMARVGMSQPMRAHWRLDAGAGRHALDDA